MIWFRHIEKWHSFKDSKNVKVIIVGMYRYFKPNKYIEKYLDTNYIDLFWFHKLFMFLILKISDDCYTNDEWWMV